MESTLIVSKRKDITVYEAYLNLYPLPEMFSLLIKTMLCTTNSISAFNEVDGNNDEQLNNNPNLINDVVAMKNNNYTLFFETFRLILICLLCLSRWFRNQKDKR